MIIQGVICKLKNEIKTSISKPLIRSFSASSQRRRLVDIASKDGELRVFIVSGEVSGDSIASRLMSSLKRLSPLPIRFAGVGGSSMSKEGLQSLFPMEDIAVMGIWELLPHLSKIKEKLDVTTESALSFRPHVVVTIDSKGFSFRLLKQLQVRHSRGGVEKPLHVHYVSPSFWAWKGGEARLERLSEFVDHLMCILPFEEEVCRSNGLSATYVGHPILEDSLDLNQEKGATQNGSKVHGNAKGFREKYGVPSGSTLIAVLPGSRQQEVTRMLPIFSNTVELLKELYPGLTTVIPVAPNHDVEKYINSNTMKAWPVPNILIPGGLSRLKYEALSASEAALCTSGSAAMELLCARLPCVVAYRAHFLTEWFISFKAKIPYISLPNILLDAPVIPEVLFNRCTPKNLATALSQVIDIKAHRERQIDGSEKVMELLLGSLRERQDLVPKELRSRFPRWPPSMIAASTILYSL